MNDKIKLILDFTKKTISFYYNEQFAAVVFENIPDVLYPVISCDSGFGGLLSISCTKFGPCAWDIP